MVVALGPGKFYGSSLPRPRFYTDVKLNSERIDPPSSVLAPFLAWAQDAHWSMGGLSFQRTRLQGRIEGSVKRLRAQQEDRARKSPTPAKIKKVPVAAEKTQSSPSPVNTVEGDGSVYLVVKDATLAELFRGRKRMIAAGGSLEPSKRARKLGDVFDQIAAAKGMESVNTISTRTRSRSPAVVESVGFDQVLAMKEAPASRRASLRKKSF